MCDVDCLDWYVWWIENAESVGCVFIYVGVKGCVVDVVVDMW